MDGKPLPEKDSSGRVNYTARSGSVIIELKPEYLESLALGQHKITVGFDDGKDASASFTIQKEQENKAANKDNKKNNSRNSSGRSAASGTANDSPRTGDENRLGIWLILFLLAGSVMLLNSNYFLRSKK